MTVLNRVRYNRNERSLQGLHQHVCTLLAIINPLEALPCFRRCSKTPQSRGLYRGDRALVGRAIMFFILIFEIRMRAMRSVPW